MSASDLVNHAGCQFLTSLELEAARRGTARPEYLAPDLLARIARGFDHEAAYLDELRASGASIYEVETDRSTSDGLLLNALQTQAAMERGHDVVYQPTFLQQHGGFTWQGHGDFAIRNERGIYEIYDTKLARTVKPQVLIQLGLYSEMLGAVQGAMPEHLHVVLGDGRIESYRVDEVLPFVRMARERFELDIRAADFPTYPQPVRQCGVCAWNAQCETRWREDDHLSNVFGMRGAVRESLERAGVHTVSDLAFLGPNARVAGLSDVQVQGFQRQAKVQVDGRLRGERIYELAQPREGTGLVALPRRSAHDIFLDFEANDLERNPRFAYLFVTAQGADAASASVQRFWANTNAEEKRNIQALARMILRARHLDPEAHVYHWGSFDRSLMQVLMEHHRIPLIDDICEAFVDLHAIFREGGRFSERSTSLKEAEKLWSPEARESEGVDGASSIAMREDYLRSRDRRTRREIKADLIRYCEEDTVQLLGAHAFLAEQAQELAARRWVPVRDPMRRPKKKAAVENPDDSAEIEGSYIGRRLDEAEALLRQGLPEQPHRDRRAQAARRVMADLINWHRRERKDDWREFFERREFTSDQCVEDVAALGRLRYLEGLTDPNRYKRYCAQGLGFNPEFSVLERYSFDWSQHHRLHIGDRVIAPRTEEENITIVDIDDVVGVVTVKRSRKNAYNERNAHRRLTDLAPGRPPSVAVLQTSLLNAATELLAGTPNADRAFGLVPQLLLAAPPRLRHRPGPEGLVRRGEDQTDAVIRLVRELHYGVLNVQGPPGSGKTYALAEAVCAQIEALRAAGRDRPRIGVMAASHKVVSNALTEIAEHAAARGLEIDIVQKCDTMDRALHDGVRVVKSSEGVLRSLDRGYADVVGGTAWLFAKPELLQRFDLLVVDEAGQISLADTVAAAPSAKNMLQVGDPAQLVQPIRGRHPESVKTSAMGHFLGGEETMPADRGVFFEYTRRLGANNTFVSRFNYEDRLQRHPAAPHRRIVGVEPPNGIIYVPVPHEAENRSSSMEEAQRVAHLIERLMAYEFDDGEGNVRPVALSDVLVVTPYNAQKGLIEKVVGQRFGAGSRVLTVDKAQGQEAPVVIYSLGTSNPARSPRGSEFTLSKHRLNVAISRAQCFAVVVSAPGIFEAPVSSPDELLRYSAHLGLLELADGTVATPDRRDELNRLGLGECIRAARLARGESQDALARRSGCSARTVRRLERGHGGFESLDRVATALGWDAERVALAYDGLDPAPLEVATIAELSATMEVPRR